MRAYIAAIPDGIYPFEAPMDSDGIVASPVQPKPPSPRHVGIGSGRSSRHATPGGRGR